MPGLKAKKTIPKLKSITAIPEEKSKFPFEEDKIYADIFIVGIEKDKVLFRSVKRTPDGKVMKVAKLNKKGEVIGEQIVWEDTIRRMSFADFSSFIEERKKHFILTVEE